MAGKQSETYWVKVFLAGPIDVAKQIIRREAKVDGLCVTIDPTTYIYTGGEEAGYVVGFINYPRFPKEQFEIWHRAEALARMLQEETYQDSFTMMAPDHTYFYTTRTP